MSARPATDNRPSEWLTVPAAAKRMGCGPRTIYTAIERGQLRAVPINERGDLRMSTAWLDEWLVNGGCKAREKTKT